MPERFLLQILRSLVNDGILKSTRGVEGGYSLTRPIDEISLLQVFEVTDGPMTSELPPLDGLPSVARKNIAQVMRNINAAMCQNLARVKLSDLVPTTSGGGAAPASVGR